MKENKEQAAGLESVAVTLERAGPSEIEQFLTIQRSVADDKTFSACLDPEQAKHTIENNLTFFIKRGGVVAGLVSLEQKGENHVYIDDLIIDPHYQSQGLARKALENVMDTILKNKDIDLVTHPDNGRAINLYESLGFVREGEVLEDYFGDGEPRVYMIRRSER